MRLLAKILNSENAKCQDIVVLGIFTQAKYVCSAKRQQCSQYLFKIVIKAIGAHTNTHSTTPTHTHPLTYTHTIFPPSHMYTPSPLSTLPLITVQNKGEGLNGYYCFLSQFSFYVWIQSRATLMFDSHTGKPSYIVCMNLSLGEIVCVKGRTLTTCMWHYQHQAWMDYSQTFT